MGEKVQNKKKQENKKAKQKNAPAPVVQPTIKPVEKKKK